ncbi:hypothetical protein BN979_01121 [Mycolicibacterium vulneris]|nr:hypothetical protein BN979_01121 [Mycolicibacterium vulneris]
MPRPAPIAKAHNTTSAIHALLGGSFSQLARNATRGLSKVGSAVSVGIKVNQSNGGAGEVDGVVSVGGVSVVVVSVVGAVVSVVGAVVSVVGAVVSVVGGMVSVVGGMVSVVGGVLSVDGAYVGVGSYVGTVDDTTGTVGVSHGSASA